MISTAKCPKCDKRITHVDVEPIEVHQNLQKAYEGVVFLCPHCDCVLSTGFDPLLLTEDIAAAVQRKLKKG